MFIVFTKSNKRINLYSDNNIDIKRIDYRLIIDWSLKKGARRILHIRIKLHDYKKMLDI